MNDLERGTGETPPGRRSEWELILILIGTGLLVTVWMGLAWIPVWVAGLGLLGLGASRQEVRLIIAGGIMTGTGLAIVIQTGPWILRLSGQARTSLFLACLAMGWLLIPPLARLAAAKRLWWPFIPGAAMAITAIAFWVTPGWVKAITSLAWPALLVLAGLILIIRWNQTK